MRQFVIRLLLFSLLAACTPAAAPQPTETAQPAQQIEAVQRAEEALAQDLNLEMETIQVIQVEDAEWPDACLGLAREDEVCAQVVTPGFKVTLQAQGKQYIYRTDETGSVVRLEGTTE
jgi:hypothetical protein